LGSNRFQYGVEETLNASLEANSPTEFDAGGFQLIQHVASANFSKPISGVAQGLNLAFGTEYRFEEYRIFAGETASWKQYLDANGQPPFFRSMALILLSVLAVHKVFRVFNQRMLQ
jgi:hypothetical protein